MTHLSRCELRKSTLLLLAFGLLIIYASTMSSSVLASPTLNFTPKSGPDGTYVTVTGTNFSPSDVTCSISNGQHVIEPGSQSCRVSGGALSGSFTIATAAPAGTYIIVATGSTGDKGWKGFTVVPSSSGPPPSSGPSITLTDTSTGTNSGSPGDTVSVTGSGFGNVMIVMSCKTGMTSNGLIMDSPTCTYNGGTITGSFVIDSSTPSGTYQVTVTALSFSASAPFTVTSSQQPPPQQGQTGLASIALTPTSGSDGTSVSVSGTGFNPQDTVCQIQAVLADGSPAQIVGSPSCSISGGGVTGGFTVESNNQPGTYDIVVAGDQGDYAYAPFIVTTITTTSVTATTALTFLSMTTNTVTSTLTQTSTIFSTATSTSTAPIIPGINPSMNPVILLIFAVLGACAGAGVAYAFTSRPRKHVAEGGEQ